ncbi:peroxisomal membrane protein PMP34 [Strongylocentrotus purpuratus]|uniref:Peroxisomal membrane protein PMP34 n=1 Tax=Strongylocentrotus purpuratus TaxID=7668 RepID=A0A7M7NQY5_STRPU|nr:peroxisomal membrane protein PMP34 [Strongylocentrotus purpuratus]|eukprot:XP_783345.2 PREDICTED: peroxisomal membrane protein PMP34 [Strongylocentrotus purpuratus]
MANPTTPSIFSYDTLVHAVSGATGSTIAMSVFYPLETARSRLQIDENRTAKHTPYVVAEIVQDEGVASLYRGWYPVISSLWCSNFVYFYTFNGLKVALGDIMKSKKAVRDLLIGISAGVVNVLATTPMWVVNTRLKMQGVQFKTKHFRESKHPKYSGIMDAFEKIIDQEGVQALWSGTISSLMLVINPAIHFAVYEALKRYHSRIFDRKEPSVLQFFLIGALAKTMATLCTYPLQVVQSKLRYGKEKETHKGSMIRNIGAVLTHIIATQGKWGLYKGLEAKLLQTVLTAALMFLCYEKISRFIFVILRANGVKR